MVSMRRTRQKSPSPPPPKVVHNQPPIGRAARLQHKEDVEKGRLKQRKFGHMRYDAGIVDKPLHISENSCQYSSAAERFDGSTAERERQNRERKIERQREIDARKREHT